jgi:hypothetical protein
MGIREILDDPNGGQTLTKVMGRVLFVAFVSMVILAPVYSYFSGSDRWWITLPFALLMLWELRKNVRPWLNRQGVK